MIEALVTVGIFIQILTFGLLALVARDLHPPEEMSVLGAPRKLKPWGKKELKRKPKANDDDAAWMKENNIER